MVADERDAVHGPVVADEVTGAVEPVAHDGEEAGLEDIGGRVLPPGSDRTAARYAARNSPAFDSKCAKTDPLAMPTSAAIASTRAPSYAVLGELADRGGDDRLPLGGELRSHAMTRGHVFARTGTA